MRGSQVDIALFYGGQKPKKVGEPQRAFDSFLSAVTFTFPPTVNNMKIHFIGLCPSLVSYKCNYDITTNNWS